MADTVQARGGHGIVQLLDLLEFAIEQANDGIAVMKFTDDPNVPIRIVYANAAIERFSGFSREELFDHSNPFLRAQPQNRARYDAFLDEVKRGRSVQFEIELTGKDRATHAQIRWSPLAYRGEAVTHYVAVLRDVTEHKRAQRDREDLDLFRSILSESADLVMITDNARPSEGGPRVTFLNAACGMLLGAEQEQLVGANLVDFMSPNNDGVLLATVKSRLETRENIAHEVLLTSRDRGDVWVELTGHPVRGGEGHVTSWFFIGRDISVRKRGYAQTAQLLTALDFADERIAIYGVLARLEVELQHMNARAAESAPPLLEGLLADFRQRRRFQVPWAALEQGKDASHLVCVQSIDEHRWVTLELRATHLGDGGLASLIVIEHDVHTTHHGEQSDAIAAMLALSREIRAYPDATSRKEALEEVLYVEWGARVSYADADGDANLAIRTHEHSGEMALSPGIVSEAPVTLTLRWDAPIPSRRLTALRIFLETLGK